MIVGIGVDVVEISRVRAALERQGDRFVRRIYTQAEQEFCGARKDPAPHFAVRFAAKEAVFKALGTGWAKGVTWKDVEVHRTEPDAPVLCLRGEAERRAQAFGAVRTHVTLSHSEHWAIAVVILETPA